MVLRPCKGRDSCVLLFVMIKECKRKTDCQTSQACKGKTDVTLSDCPANQTGKFGDQVGPSKPFIVSVYNENTDVFVDSGPI